MNKVEKIVCTRFKNPNATSPSACTGTENTIKCQFIKRLFRSSESEKSQIENWATELLTLFTENLLSGGKLLGDFDEHGDGFFSGWDDLVGWKEETVVAGISELKNPG